MPSEKGTLLWRSDGNEPSTLRANSDEDLFYTVREMGWGLIEVRAHYASLVEPTDIGIGRNIRIARRIAEDHADASAYRCRMCGYELQGRNPEDCDVCVEHGKI